MPLLQECHKGTAFPTASTRNFSSSWLLHNQEILQLQFTVKKERLKILCQICILNIWNSTFTWLGWSALGPLTLRVFSNCEDMRVICPKAAIKESLETTYKYQATVRKFSRYKIIPRIPMPFIQIIKKCAHLHYFKNMTKKQHFPYLTCQEVKEKEEMLI